MMRHCLSSVRICLWVFWVRITTDDRTSRNASLIFTIMVYTLN